MTQLLSVKQAADALNVKVPTLRLWLNQRKLPRVNCGRAVRIPAAAIAEFIDRNTIPALGPRR
jgi:excisionase family DNA binding protein